MKTPSLFGSMVAALLIASPGIALAQTNGNGGGNGYGNNGYRGGFVGNNGGENGNGNGNSAVYANIGEGGYSGMGVPVRNGNNGGGNGGWFGNNGNGNRRNAENMRPSQRNHLLADNGDVRVGKMIGTGVHNDNGNNIGSVNGVLIGRNGIWAIVATNNKKVAVPFRDFVFGDGNVNGNDTLVLPHVSQAELNSRPAFHYHLTNYPSYNGNNGGGWFSNNNAGNGYANNGGRGYAGNNNGGGWFGHNGGSNNGGGNNGNNGNGNNG